MSFLTEWGANLCYQQSHNIFLASLCCVDGTVDFSIQWKPCSHEILDVSTVFFLFCFECMWTFRKCVLNNSHDWKYIEWTHMHQYICSWNLGLWSCLCHHAEHKWAHSHDQMNAYTMWLTTNVLCCVNGLTSSPVWCGFIFHVPTNKWACSLMYVLPTTTTKSELWHLELIDYLCMCIKALKYIGTFQNIWFPTCKPQRPAIVC